MKNKPQNKQRTPFNVVDAGILLILLAVLLVSAYFVFFADRFFPANMMQENGEKKIVYMLEIRGIDNDLLNGENQLPVMIGEEVYHVDAAYVIGTLSAISEVLPHMTATSATDDNGDLKYASRPDKSNFILEIEANASFMDGSYVVNGRVLRIGDTFTIATPYFMSSVYCKDIREVNDHE